LSNYQLVSMKKSARSFRLVCSPDQVSDVEALLYAEGFAFIAEPFFHLARTLITEPFPLGRSLAARFGYIYIQDKSSMLPPLALAPPKGAVVLDLCASPGSKTGILSHLVGPTGLVLANEPSPDRLATLRQNMRHLGCFNVVTCRYEAQHLPLPPHTWPFILLDAPCSGWGTIEKNPQAAQIWSGEKTAPLEALQRELLAQAARLLAPGGHVLYSTCTTNMRENEDQIRYALDFLGLEIVPLSPFAGFTFAPSLPGCLLVDGRDSSAQGFFLACLTRPGSGKLVKYDTTVLPGTLLGAQEFSTRTGLNTSWLPEHEFLCASGHMYLILNQAKQVLPQGLHWQGLRIGKEAKGALLPDLTLRSFIPIEPTDQDLILSEPQDMHKLLAGQSWPYSGPAKRRALYYKNLPLGYLTVKGKRCLWSDR